MNWPVSWLQILIAVRLYPETKFVSQRRVADAVDHLTSRGNIQSVLNKMFEGGMLERADEIPIAVRLSPGGRADVANFLEELEAARAG